MLAFPSVRIGHLFIAIQVYAILLVSAPVLAESLDGVPPLRESFDPRLQEKLEKTLRSLELWPAVENGKLAVALVDIVDLVNPRLAAVNGDEMYYAASLPKIAILLGAFVEIERGRLQITPEIRGDLTDMIRKSSNSAATKMLNLVGKQRLIEILRSEPYRLYDPAVNGGLWVGKEYASSEAYERDPLHNLSHGATAIQTARFYYLLETGQLVNRQLAEEMKTILSEPGINHKFVKGLAGIPGIKIYRKSGSWRHWHSDSALIEAGRHKYILVALAEDEAGGQWLSRIAESMHRLIESTGVAPE
jgi:beta-lactamase class A